MRQLQYVEGYYVVYYVYLITLIYMYKWNNIYENKRNKI